MHGQPCGAGSKPQSRLANKEAANAAASDLRGDDRKNDITAAAGPVPTLNRTGRENSLGPASRRR
ncbi:hypothetical protein SAMN05216330_11195 [Bradyrhizobium sp. Ghvi]|nr:hypothetical protein SAMN05216330_11195 [Bradyrhizobium sp. Ghvi]